jgi:multiple sugar transport system substrate-binding protein
MKRSIFKGLSILIVVLMATACATPATTTTIPATSAPATSAPASAATSTTAPAGANTTAPTTAAATSPAATGTPQAQVPVTGLGSFPGVTVNVVTFTGPQIAEPLQRRAPDFEKATGAKINIITVPMSDLYNKILTDFTTGTNSYDVIVYDPQWMGDFASTGYLLDLTSLVANDPTLQWNDILPYFRDFSASYQGKVYDIPLDGDLQMVYYRKDMLAKDGIQPPQTWDDYIAIAKKYQGATFPDGQPGYGSCLAMKRGAQSYWMFLSILAPYLQTKGTSQGAFFDASTMQPLINNDAGVAALGVYQQLSKLGPPDQLNEDVGASRGLFTSGRCALSLDWGDVGVLATDKTTSKITSDQVGSIMTPGTKMVLDRASGKLVACDATTCPDAVNGVNHAPFAAFGGWSGAISAAAKPDVQKAAFAFLSYMSAPAQSDVDVTLGKTGFNPYRQTQFTNMAPWLAAGFSQAGAQNYIGAIQSSLNSPNMVLDLRIPQNARYEGTVLDTALAQFLAGDIDAPTTAKQITDGWNQLTDQIGRQNVTQVYDSSLNIKK